ncbi:uncharacterized protein G2W53_041338 [Senna tora]|uniref:Uncharacterized protein n=1 Tax=Senna tora TaxID=362788 RepID=A0A834SFC0_9FABA|nr:uncharacterized protein G2W53_041338 [Senna tora]
MVWRGGVVVGDVVAWLWRIGCGGGIWVGEEEKGKRGVQFGLGTVWVGEEWRGYGLGWGRVDMGLGREGWVQVGGLGKRGEEEEWKSGEDVMRLWFWKASKLLAIVSSRPQIEGYSELAARYSEQQAPF